MITPIYLSTDFYKLSHREQYPKGTTTVYSTLTPRSNKYAPWSDEIVFFGLQYFINDTDWERLGYLFSMETPHQIKPVLVAHINLLNNGANVYIEHYESEQITKEHALQSLQSIIGLENK